MSTETAEPLPERHPGAHLPTRYRTDEAIWSRRTGRIAVSWAESLSYDLLARVRGALPNA